MFDVGFSELALIAVVALVVLGPERLPEAARALGKWVGRARRMMRQMSEELEREVDVSDLRQQFRDAKRSVEEEWEEPAWHEDETAESASDDSDTVDEGETAAGDVVDSEYEEPDGEYAAAASDESAEQSADEPVTTASEPGRDEAPTETEDEDTVDTETDTDSDNKAAAEDSQPRRDHTQSRVH